jgi:hypothetical protein
MSSPSGKANGNTDGARKLDPSGRASDQRLSFQFVPAELTARCRELIESYHGIHGYAGLPDMLWLSDARDVIEYDLALTDIFHKASKSRGAKRANDSLMFIAAGIVSLEVLSRDFVGWGKRFPAAKRAAEKLLGDFPPRQQRYLMEFYFYPVSAARREFANTLTNCGNAAMEGGLITPATERQRSHQNS